MKSKKLLLGSLSAMALVATPIATVVSCGKDTPAAAKITKSNAKGFVIRDGDVKIFIPEDAAKKSGSINFENIKYSWTKEMEAGKTLKATPIRKSASSLSRPHDVKISKSDAEHFILPVKGWIGGGFYVDRVSAKYWVGQLLAMEKLDFILPTAIKDGQTIVSKESIKKLNTFLKVMDLTVESVELKLYKATADTPKHIDYRIHWAKTSVKTVSEFKTQFESLGIDGTATSVTPNSTAGTTALTDISAIQNAAGSGVTLIKQSAKPFSIPKGFTVTFKGITAFDSKGHSNLTLTLTKIADKTTADVNIHINKVSGGSSSTTVQDNADITAVKGLFTTAAITGANTTAVTAVTTAGTTGITDMPTIAGVTWTHAFPTNLNGVKVTVKSIGSVAATSGATGNIVLELTKGTGIAQTVTIAITHA